MKRRDFVLYGISLVAAYGCSRKPKHGAIPPNSRVLAFGDSVTYGTGAALGEDWPTLLNGFTG
jgi:acyl-CoA thioesterase-1